MLRLIASAGLFHLLVAPIAQAAETTEALRLAATEGRIHNEFFREGAVAAHLVLTSGSTPRLVVAFPAGNSGVAAWFAAPGGELTWQPGAVVSSARGEQDGDVLRGITAEVELSGAPVTVRHVIASSVRVIRDYGYTGETPGEVLTQPQIGSRTITWQRRRIDGAPGYHVSFELLNGKIDGAGSEPVRLVPDEGSTLRLRVTALTGEEPLVPIDESDLLTAGAKADPELRQKLAFLSYEGKLLAGSWRFNTYFGRDTLMSLELLMPVLQPSPIEAGLAAVLERLNGAGEVAHEEDIGEYAVLRHLAEDGRPADAPIYDYKMIDDDFLLPIVAAHYLLATPAGRARAEAFLARETRSGETHGSALARNFRFVLAEAAAFAGNPDWRNLIALKPGQSVGNWRDSEDGLGGGRFPYDVNGIFVPAALAAVESIHGAGLLERHIEPGAAAIAFSDAGAMADAWLRYAPGYFDVVATPGVARREVADYAKSVGVTAQPGLSALGDDPVTFRAVALDENGSPVPVLNSDEAFALLFLAIAPGEAARIVTTLTRPFPAGLMTDVGPVVANPAYADELIEPEFGRARYHGTVIWSWQQALLTAGIARQLRRDDLPASVRRVLSDGLESLEAAMADAHAVRGSELWSWSQADGRYRVEPFGQRSGDETESNAAQLWSTVHLVPLPGLAQPPGE